MSTRITILPHTHWDREWYVPFETYRAQLVQLVDELLDTLENDESFTHFLLDGQTQIIEDYLEIRPKAKRRLQKLIASNRIAIGPWSTLLDEFMVSGETIVRNLQKGLRDAQIYGEPMRVGYLPDMFGHIAQMPQILKLAGINDAVVRRGVPKAIDKTAFWWEALDGTRVRTEFLFGGYSSGRELPDDPEALIARVEGAIAELGSARLENGDVLLMNGGDHQFPKTNLGTIIGAANTIQDKYELRIEALRDYLSRQPQSDLPVWKGELRSSAYENVLPGVASNRVDVHKACARGERALSQAETLAALFSPEYPTELIERAWDQLILNSAHDSSCACSHDEVVDQVKVRYFAARQIADAVTNEMLTQIGKPSTAEQLTVFNTSPYERGGIIEVEILNTITAFKEGGELCAVQVLEELPTETYRASGTGDELVMPLNAMRGSEFAGSLISSYDLQDSQEEVVVSLQIARPNESLVQLDGLREQLTQYQESERLVVLRKMRAPTARALVYVPNVPPSGWTTLEPTDDAAQSSAVWVDGMRAGNELLEIAIESDGTFNLIQDGLFVDGCNELVDGGDGGDTYNYSPPVTDDVIFEPKDVYVRALEAGPVRARLAVYRTFDVPAAAIGDERFCQSRTAERKETLITSILEIRAAEPFVRIHTEFDNQNRDHRLRAHFPLPVPVTGSHAECAYGVVERSLEREGGPSEAGIPTFVSQRFVDCSDGEAGLALLHDGLLEYEVTEDGNEVALTLLRAIGYISRSEPALRPNPAGPQVPVQGAQMLGEQHSDYAVMLHTGSWRDANLDRHATLFLDPLQVARRAMSKPKGQTLQVDGAEVTAVYREGKKLHVRIVNLADKLGTARVWFRGKTARGERIDLLGNAMQTFDGELELRPFEIATLRLKSRMPIK